MTESAEMFGFLSVCTAGDAKLGGYLLVDTLGRPLEFHCTEPVKPNRAQQILYGKTLDSFLCGERIAHSLIKHGSKMPCCVLTDCPDVLSVRKTLDIPVMLLGDKKTYRTEQLVELSIGERTFGIRESAADDQESLREAVLRMDEKLDPYEPFERIHGAVEELRKAA